MVSLLRSGCGKRTDSFPGQVRLMRRRERPSSRNRSGWHGRTVNGQEMAEGSDGSGNELGMELGGGRSESCAVSQFAFSCVLVYLRSR